MADIQNDLALLSYSQSVAVLFRRSLQLACSLSAKGIFIIKNETFPGATLEQLDDFLVQ